MKLFASLLCPFAVVFVTSAAPVSELHRFNDGVPDQWRRDHFGRFWWTGWAAATADPDRDGANNYLEYLTGTDPLDRRSFDSHPVRVSTWAGSEQGWRDGFRTDALLIAPRDMAFDPFDRLWFTENGEARFGETSHRIRLVTREGNIVTLTGGAQPGDANGPIERAGFHFPQTPVFDSRGNAYIADIYNHRVRKIDPDGNVSTFAGSTLGYRNGIGTDAQFHTVQSLCIDGDDNLYVADWDNICIRKITPAGEVSLFAGKPSVRGRVDGPRLQATFETPGHMAFAPNGDMFVVDWANGLLRVIGLDGNVSTFASGLSYTHRVIVDEASNVYVTWGIPGPITGLRKYRPDGRIAWTIGGTPESVGMEDGPIETAKFRYAFSPVLLADGNILISDLHNHRIRHIQMAPTELLQIDAVPARGRTYTISISTIAEDAELRYTVGGAHPQPFSPLYRGPFTVRRGTTIRARLFVNATPVSDVGTLRLPYR